MKIMSEERAQYIRETLGDEPIEDSPDVEYRSPVTNLGFAKIDHILTLDTNLSDGAYRTYALLVYYWQNKKRTWTGVKKMAEVRGVKESTLRAHLKELRDAGLITRQRRMGHSSITYLEELPKRYQETAADILEDRRNNRGKSASTIAVESPVLSPTEEEPVEEEPKKNIGAKTAPTLPRKELPDKLAADAEFDALPSAGAPDPKLVSLHREMVSALTTVCMVEPKLAHRNYTETAKKLTKLGYTPEQVRKWYGLDGWWYRCDYRGKLGNKPNLSTICSTIMQAKAGTQARAVSRDDAVAQMALMR